MRSRRVVSLFVGLSMALAACSGSPPPPSGSDSPRHGGTLPSPVAWSPRPASPGRVLRAGVSYAAIPRERYLPIYRRAGSAHPVFVLDTRNAMGRLAPLLVTDHRERDGRLWLRLQLPLRPNGRTGWALPGDVRLVPRDQRIVVDVSSRTLRRYVGGDLVDRLRVGVGAPETPTALGTFFVWVKVSYPPSGPYGPFALGLSGFSPVLSNWPGGGRMAIHGTSNPTDRGREVSHGCIRVFDPQLLPLRNVPLGTPVTIRR